MPEEEKRSTLFDQYMALLEVFKKQAIERRQEELRRLGKTEDQLWYESVMYRHAHSR